MHTYFRYYKNMTHKLFLNQVACLNGLLHKHDFLCCPGWVFLSHHPQSHCLKDCEFPVGVCFVLWGKTRQPILLNKFICGFIIPISGACRSKGGIPVSQILDMLQKEKYFLLWLWRRECVVLEGIIWWHKVKTNKQTLSVIFASEDNIPTFFLPTPIPFFFFVMWPAHLSVVLLWISLPDEVDRSAALMFSAEENLEVIEVSQCLPSVCNKGL